MQTKICLFFYILTCLLQLNKSDYIAAVVEIEPYGQGTPKEIIKTNSDVYVHQIQEAQRSLVQIIVFPEYGLTGIQENPEEFAIEIPSPSDNKSIKAEVLQKLGNAALSHEMYVVVNLLEKSTNAENKTIYYNTNVVFDKTGSIIAKYRKINLYREPKITPGNVADGLVTFTTDFGVTFGTFTCFDITSYYPSKSILLKTNVTDIVYPTAWISVMPFYHSLSIQFGYALANKVNLLAANYNNVTAGNGGSGIYGADGTIYYSYISGRGASKLIISNVRSQSSDSKNFNTYGLRTPSEEISTLANYLAIREFDSEKYRLQKLDVSKSLLNEEVCHRSFCCQFTVDISSIVFNGSETYYVMAYNGPTKMGNNKNVKICAFLTCASSEISTCGLTNTTTLTKYNSISVETSNAVKDGEIFYPTSLKSDLTPVSKINFTSTTYDNKVRSKSILLENEDNIISFGILGISGASTSSINLLATMVVFIVAFISF